MKTKIINLFAGAGCGKTTIMSDIFKEMKWLKYESEIVPEFAKKLVWENRLDTLSNQFYVSANQYQDIRRLYDKVDYIITDSPILLGIIYDSEKDENLKNYLLSKHNEIESINILLKREKEYNPNGRLQTLEQAIEKDKEVENLLLENNIPFHTVKGNRSAFQEIINIINNE